MTVLNDNFTALDYNFTFSTALKVNPTEGNLVYEYNPFFNYRLDRTMAYYKNRLWELEQLAKELNISYDKQEGKFNITSWDGVIPEAETPPVIYLKGQLVDFETDELNFSLNNPVNILPQYSYDNSVNLIINDGLNPPRLINSRFSATEKNKYLVCDRKGNNDSNIYDQGDEFDVDTSLYKKITTIPELQFVGVGYGGNLKIGNYHFYFRYVDDDGNMSDFFAESGLVSIFIGNAADSIRSGFREENSHKLVKFIISNTDPSYQEILIYYTKATSDINQNAIVGTYKIDRKYKLSDSGNTLITITGFEEINEIDISEINPIYQVYGSAETLELCQNMLFLANVDRPKLPYEDLADCALRFLPYVDIKSTYPVELIGEDYSGSISGTYYDASYIYKKVGYHCDEIYRLGIVFILSDNTLSEVFNVRGTANLSDNANGYSSIDFYKETDNGKVRNYINFDEKYYNIVNESETVSTLLLENAKGVIKTSNYPFNTVIGINFKVNKEVIDYLQNTLKVKGFFFVRLKRIPTTLCLAYTIGIDNLSHTPVIPANDNKFWTESFITKYKENSKGKESSESRVITHERKDRMREVQSYEASSISIGAICPEYDVNSPYLNTLFTGSEFRFKEQLTSLNLKNDDDGRHFVCTIPTQLGLDTTTNSKVIGVEDNVKLVAINNAMFSARAGEAEEAFRYEYIGLERVLKNSDNVLRGSYGPYLGITGYDLVKSLINIKIPGYSEGNLLEYFEIRFHDKSLFYPISYRMDLSRLSKWLKKDGENYILKDSLYRGDCYICQFTHRINRNFLDPSSPANDKIVDQNCWKDHYDVSDGVVKKDNFEKINLGDINAVRLGMYITLYVRSTINLNIRAQDDSNVDEIGLFGHSRSFYPQYSMSNSGAYKIPEALCYNKGFEKSLSEKIFFEVPDIPWIKNEFSNRIAYSEMLVTDAFENGWRTFLGTHYRDYPKTYGSITKIVELRGNLICVFEHGVALIPINERAIAGEGSGGNVYINTSNVLPENPKIISDTFGSLWKDSVIKTPLGIYGVDTIGKKIWRTNGENFECISDFKVLEFLNQNISLSERELDPIIGVRNVKTHYNKFKRDIMFTFYDNLYGFEEKVWNLCYNELQQKWITFYSWVPSYSENIHNLYFSFDRNTSKWITKLGISHSDNNFSDGATLSNNIIPNSGRRGYRIGELSLSNRELPLGEGISYKIKYSLQRDNFGNWKKFEIKEEEDGKSYLRLKPDIHYLYNRSKNSTSTNKYTLPENLLSDEWISTIPTENAIEYPYVWRRRVENNDLNQSTYELTDQVLKPTIGYDSIDLCSELYKRYNSSNPNEKIDDLSENSSLIDKWKTDSVLGSKYKIAKDENGRRQLLFHSDTKDCRRNPNTIVYLLNIKAEIEISYEKSPDISLSEAYASGFKNGMKVDGGYYESVVAVMPQYNMLFLTTDFWKHGLSGIIDIADKINPTHWYGKQHPFEFEFIVADNPQLHKIFDNLEIISNSAEPESFHYEIIGDCYEFAKDKKNMYIRQEATKELYQYNGSDILFDSDYVKLDSEHRKRYMILNGAKILLQGYDKSTLFPLYYCRRNDFNNIEDYYHLKDGTSLSKDFSALSGAEIVRYDNLQEYRIWNHAKAINIADDTKGRIRGNMLYKEDKWCILINPINLVQNNEPTWTDLDNLETDKIPVELNLNPLPDDVLNPDEISVPLSFEASENSKGRGYTLWKWEESLNKEVKIKDKWIKIRVRYSGDKLAIITAIRTLYSASYA